MAPNTINSFNGTPIALEVHGPDTVTSGDAFTYKVYAKDIDLPGPLNPRAIDPSLRIAFQINSMTHFQWQIAPNPDPQDRMVCIIHGIAGLPGLYTDGFRAYNQLGGPSWDPPTDVLHSISVVAPEE